MIILVWMAGVQETKYLTGIYFKLQNLFHKFTLQVDINLCPKNIKRRELNENKLIWRQKKTRVQWIMVKFLKEIQELSSNSLKITMPRCVVTAKES